MVKRHPAGGRPRLVTKADVVRGEARLRLGRGSLWSWLRREMEKARVARDEAAERGEEAR
jgi:hypothetical protein